MSQLYANLVADNHPTGKITSVRRFKATVSGLPGAVVGSEVLTEDGVYGLVKEIKEDEMLVDLLTSEHQAVGRGVVLQRPQLVIHPSHELLGRVVDPLLKPLDGGKPIAVGEEALVFGPAPSFSERMLLDRQLETGITLVDTLFPIVMGQRIAIMGDAKAGKTTFTTQMAIHQAALGRKIVLVLIAKRRTDVEQIVDELRKSGALANTVLVVADSFASLPLAYLAPYSGVTVAEYLWHSGSDTIIIYDDLSSHAKIYREMALLEDSPPGRESYPGDMFFQHSSLLERAGRITSNQRTLTALPIMTTANNDITSYLSTALISITDGQIVFDTEEMQRGNTPPVHVGLSVSRVGGRAQETLQKKLAQEIFRSLAAYRQASSFAHFGQDLPDQYREALQLGDRIWMFFNQEAGETYSLPEQQVLLKAAFLAGDKELDVAAIKANVKNMVNDSLASLTHEDLAQKMIDMHHKGAEK